MSITRSAPSGSSSGGGPSRLYTNLARVEAVSTAAEFPLVSYTLGAGELANNGYLKLQCGGVLINNSGSSRTFTFRVDLAGTDILTTSALTVVTGVTEARWGITLEAFKISAASHKWHAHLRLGTASAVNWMAMANHYEGYNTDTTDLDSASRLLTVTVQPSFSATTVYCRNEFATIEKYAA